MQALQALKPESLKRYKDIIALLIKYGRSDLVRQTGLHAVVGQREPSLSPTIAPKAEELANDLEKLGATFIKLGQLLSTRGDLLPEPYLDALSRLQDQIEPFPYEIVEQIVSSELGVRISKIFPEFDREPMAAASLAQVHRAYLRDGRAVVVKIQRPGVRDLIVNDLEARSSIDEADGKLIIQTNWNAPNERVRRDTRPSKMSRVRQKTHGIQKGSFLGFARRDSPPALRVRTARSGSRRPRPARKPRCGHGSPRTPGSSMCAGRIPPSPFPRRASRSR